MTDLQSRKSQNLNNVLVKMMTAREGRLGPQMLRIASSTLTRRVSNSQRGVGRLLELPRMCKENSSKMTA